MKNYYELLEVSQTASPEVISKVYKLLAKKYHPDVQTGLPYHEAEEKFKEISEAYEILSDTEKRKQYDAQLEQEKLQNYVPLSEYQELKNYCISLEDKIATIVQGANSNTNYSYDNANYNNYYTNSANNNYSNNFDNAANAYTNNFNNVTNNTTNNNYTNSSYDNFARNYARRDFKRTMQNLYKNIIALIITIAVLFILFKLIWSVPALKQLFLSFFPTNISLSK